MNFSLREIIVFVLFFIFSLVLIAVTGGAFDWNGSQLFLSVVVMVLGVLLFLFRNRTDVVVKSVEEKVETVEEEQTKEVEAEVKKESVKITIDLSEIKKTSLEQFLSDVLVEFSHLVPIVQAVFYVKDSSEKYQIKGSYAFFDDVAERTFEDGHGICGQVVKNKAPMHVENVPDDYIYVVSGLGKGKPKNITLIPVIDNDEVVGLIELASFEDALIDFDSFYEGINEKLVSEIAKLK